MKPLSHAFSGLLPLDHMDRFEQNPLLDRLGLKVVAFSQVTLFPQLGGQGELKTPPQLEQCPQLRPLPVSDYQMSILLMRTNLLKNFSPRRCFCLHADRIAGWEPRQKFLSTAVE